MLIFSYTLLITLQHHCSYCWEHVSWSSGSTEYKLFLLCYLGIFSLSVPMSSQDESQSRRSVLALYFQHNDQTLQQINSKHRADAIAINFYLVNAKRSNPSPSQPNVNSIHKHIGQIPELICSNTIVFTCPLNNNRSMWLCKMKTKRATMIDTVSFHRDYGLT